MKWMIAVDSSSNLIDPAVYAAQDLGAEIVPLKIGLNQQEYVDDSRLNVSDMMQAMETAQHSTSASPSPQVWQAAFEQAEQIIAITITGALSGSSASAYTAKKMTLEAHPDKKIFILDSRSTGPEMVLLVEEAVRLIGMGGDFDAVCAQLTQHKRRTHLLFVLESLDNLIKNGRVSKLEGGIAGLLGIKLLGCASKDGVLQVLKKCRGRQVYQELLAQMERIGFAGRKVVISHCFNEQRALELKKSILEKFPKCPVTVMQNRGLCSYYAQRGGVLVGFEA